MNVYFDRKEKEYFREENGRLISCSREIQVLNGVPRFVALDNYAKPFGQQWIRFQQTQLDSFIGFPLSEMRLRRCLGEDLWNNLSGKLVLEAGCGAGRFTEILLNRGAIVVSVDLSEAVEANNNNFPINSNHYIAQADILDLPFEDDFFDVVLCLGVIQHTRNSEETIYSLYRHLKHNGSMVIDHYRVTLSFVTRLLPVYRFVLKYFKVSNTLAFTQGLVNIWFPIHSVVGRRIFLYALLTRFSPIVTYFHVYPLLSKDAQRDWAVMDTHDSLFDFYKRLLTMVQLGRILEQLPNVSNIFLSKGGIGLEARFEKSARQDC